MKKTKNPLWETESMTETTTVPSCGNHGQSMFDLETFHDTDVQC